MVNEFKPTQLNTLMTFPMTQNEANFEDDVLGIFPLNAEDHQWLTFGQGSQ
jgi:hypothetical protein